MRKTLLLITVLFSLSSTGCAHLGSLFGVKPVKYSIVKVNSDKKYLQMMSRSRGVLGTSNIGKFNYDVVQLPYDLQGEYFVVTWKRTGGEKYINQEVTCRIDYKHVDGEVDSVEKAFPNPKRGAHRFLFENTGDRFVDFGEIELWKVSVIVDQEVVAEEASQLWWTVGPS